MEKEVKIAKEGRRSRMIEEQEEQEEQEEIHLTALSWLRSSNSSTIMKLPD